MKTLDEVYKTLKPINEYTDKDLITADVSDDLCREYERWANKETISKRTIDSEIKTQLKEELARVRALKREYGSTRKWIKQLKTSKDKEALVVLISDWHVGKVIKRKDKVIYNSDIAVDLLTNVYTKKIAAYLKDHNLANRIDEVVLVFLGDLVDNEIIYDTQLHKIDSPVAKQKSVAVRGIIKFVDSIEQIFKTLTKKQVAIRIEGVKGNHGRVQKGSLEVSSWDVLIYDNLDLVFGMMEKKNVVVDYTWDDYKEIEVKGHKGLLRHKAPPQAETSAGRNKYGGWCELFDWDFLCHGHFHHWGINTYNSRVILRNGTFVGVDDLSVELGSRDKRCQLIFGVSKEEAPSFMHRVILD